MNIDKQRVRGVELLEQIGYRWDGVAWSAPAAAVVSDLTCEADVMHGILMDRAERLASCVEGDDDADELAAIGAALEAYEAKRWPKGRVAKGKG